jgi:large repetitive protein
MAQGTAGAAASVRMVGIMALKVWVVLLILACGPGMGQVVMPGGQAGCGPGSRELCIPPRIVDYTPRSGAVGTSVIITGMNISRTTRITFNGVAAKFGLNTDSKVTARVPKGAKTGKIEVTTPGGKSESEGDFVVTE